MSKFAKLLLIATSLSPMLGAMGINRLVHGDPCWQWFLPTFLLPFVCWGVLYTLGGRLPGNTFTVKEFEGNDIQTIAFLLSYLLPFLFSDKFAFKGELFTGLYVIAIIALTVINADAFYFNPVMRLLGFHFYKTKGTDGDIKLLISRDVVRRSGKSFRVVSLAHNIHLQIKE